MLPFLESPYITADIMENRILTRDDRTAGGPGVKEKSDRKCHYLYKFP